MAEVSQVEGWILPADDEPPEPARVRRSRRVRLVPVLVVALVVAVGVAAVLGVRLYRADRLDVRQAAARDAVERYTAALDRHDLAGVRGVTTDQASFTQSEELRWPMLGPVTRQDRDALFGRLFAAGLRLRSTGAPQVVGEGPYRVAVPQTVHYVVAGITVDEAGMSLFTVVDRPEGPLVTDHVWWRLPHLPKPSMAWLD